MSLKKLYNLFMAEQDTQNQPQRQSIINAGGNFLLGLKNQFLEIWKRLGNLERTNIEIGLIHLHNGNFFDAAFRFKVVLWLNKKQPVANYLLGKAYVYAGKPQKAIAPLQRALLIDPGLEEAQFLLSSCGVKVDVKRVPPSLVLEQLELLAPVYEDVVKNIHSRLNDIIKKSLDAHFGEKQGFDVLVLCCRGGDVGEILLDKANRTIGVDMSVKMVGAARARRVGERLVFNEVTAKEPEEYLAASKEKFDVIFATFFVPLFGDLKQLFKNVAGHLNRKGVFCFNYQPAEIDNYRMNGQSLSFFHSPAYIDGLLAENGFRIISSDEIKFSQMSSDLVLVAEKI